MFRPNIVRVCHRLHVGVKSTMVSSRILSVVVPKTTTTTTTRHFAANKLPTTTNATSNTGGSAFVPSGILRWWYNMYVTYLTLANGWLVLFRSKLLLTQFF